MAVRFIPPWLLRSGLAMTLYMALTAKYQWHGSPLPPEPDYRSHQFSGQGGVPIYGIWAPPSAGNSASPGTIIGTYGISGSLDSEWFLQVFGRKAHSNGYGVVLFDWRAHGRTAQLSPTLTSDGLHEGPDFVHIADQAMALGCPPPYWFAGFSLGGQLVLWALETCRHLPPGLKITAADIGGGLVICPNLDAARSLKHVTSYGAGRLIEREIAKNLKQLAWAIHQDHPGSLDPEAINRANSIWGFDQELVIPRLGFPTVEAYYEASSPLQLLATLPKPTFILYAADDPLFAPDIIPDLVDASRQNPQIELLLTPQGGHVGYISSSQGQRLAKDPDRWWAWNRALDWLRQH